MLLDMERTYVIAWKSKFRGSAGQGKKLFTREEAECLAGELNHDHPNFLHEPVNLNPAESGAEPNAPVESQVIIDNIEFGSSAPETRNSPVLEEVAS